MRHCGKLDGRHVLIIIMPKLYVRLTNDQLDILQACVGMGASMAYMVERRRITFPFLRDLAQELDEIVRDSIADDVGETVFSSHPIVQQVAGKEKLKP